LPTTTTLTVIYADREEGPRAIQEVTECTGSEHLDSEDCEYSYEWELGLVAETALSNPAGAVSVTCSPSSCPHGLTGTIDGTVHAPVILKARGDVTGHYHQVPNSPTCEQVKSAATSGDSSLDRWSYPTQIDLDASPVAPGYAASVVSAALTLTPILPC
jgi:hypothetical protein